MSINLNIDAKFLGKEETNPEDIKLEVSGATVGDCLKEYLATKPDLKKDFFSPNGNLNTTTYVFINKNPLISDHLLAKVKPGDEVRFMYYEMHGC
jgi:hypothetical protein